MALINTTLYDGLGFTIANSLMGIISALIDNIPVMFSVIQMHDTTTMDLNQWLLITLTAGSVEVCFQLVLHLVLL